MVIHVFQDLASDVSVTLLDINSHLKKTGSDVTSNAHDSSQQVLDATANGQSDQRSQDDSESTVTSLDSSSTVASDNTITVNEAPALSDVSVLPSDATATQESLVAASSAATVNGSGVTSPSPTSRDEDDDEDDEEVRRYFTASTNIDAETKERSKFHTSGRDVIA